MADGRIPLSHAGRDGQPAGRPVEYLRALLVANGALPARNEPLARLERRVRAVAQPASPIPKTAGPSPPTPPGGYCTGRDTTPGSDRREVSVCVGVGGNEVMRETNRPATLVRQLQTPWSWRSTDADLGETLQPLPPPLLAAAAAL